MSKKSCFREPLHRQHGKQAVFNLFSITVSISMTAPLPYLLITVKVKDLQKVSVSDMQNLKTVY